MLRRRSGRQRALRPRQILAAILLAAAVLAPRPAPAADDKEEGLSLERSVHRVVIHGNTQYGEGKLKKLLRTRGSSFWKPWKKGPLRADYIRFDRLTLQEFYHSHGYLSARVDSAPVRERSPERADVHFYLTEGPRYVIESIRFEGQGPIPEPKLRAALTLRSGEPFDAPRQGLSRESVQNQFLEQGYISALVRDSLEVDPPRVRIVYRTDIGPRAVLGAVKVEGTSVTKPGFVTREVVLKQGDVLARSKLILSQQRIYDSGFYSDVQFDRGPTDSATAATDLIVSVRERKMGWVDAGIGYGTVDQLRLTSQLGQRNLWKDGFRFVATGRVGVRVQSDPFLTRIGDRRIDAALSRLWALGIRLNTTVGVYAEEIPKIQTETDFALRAYGASLVLGYDFHRVIRSRLAYESRRVDSDTTSLQTPIGAGRERYTTNRLGLSLERDTRVNLFDPRAGSDVVGSVEFVGGKFRGNAQFLRSSGSAASYLPLGKRATLALRVRAGNIKPQGQGPTRELDPSLTPLDLIPVDDRYRIGGATTVRGYQENEIGTRIRTTADSLGNPVYETVFGGTVLLLGNMEVRVRLTGLLGAAAFFDAGNVWVQHSDMKIANFLSFSNGAGYNDVRYSVGAGLRLGTPIGPVRFDYGWKLRLARQDQPDVASGRGEFHFSVGQAF